MIDSVAASSLALSFGLLLLKFTEKPFFDCLELVSPVSGAYREEF